MSASEGATGTAARQPQPEPKGIVCVVDLGEHSRRRIRRLRRGEGRLMERVEDAVAALQENGVLAGDSQTVVVVVRQEPSLSGLFSDDDDDEDDDDDDDD
jgi:Family of unknown function (DUF6200)